MFPDNFYYHELFAEPLKQSLSNLGDFAIEGCFPDKEVVKFSCGGRPADKHYRCCNSRNC